MRKHPKDVLLRFVAILAVFVLGGYQVFVTRQVVEQKLRPETQATAGFSIRSPWPTVRGVSPEAAAAGLRSGDRVIAIQGEPFAGLFQIEDALSKRFPGDRLSVTVRTGSDAAREVSWQLGETAAENMGFGGWFVVAVVSIFMPFLCLLVGLVTVLARPRETQAWILYAMLACFAHANVHPAYYPASLGGLRFSFQALHAVLSASWPIFMFVFAWEFPRRMDLQNRLTGLYWGGVALISASAAATAIHWVLTYGSGTDGRDWIDLLAPSRSFLFALQMAAIGGYFMLIAIKRSVLDDPDAKRRVATILYGSYVALTPMFAVILWSLAHGGLFSNVPQWAMATAAAAMAVFPVALAYVVIVQRAFGLKVVLRTGLQYILARRGVRVVQVLLSLGVMFLAFALATQPGVNRPRTIQWLSLGVLGIFGLQALAARAGMWVDRLFFRDARHTESVLEELSEEVRSILDAEPLGETVTRRLQEALHATKVALLTPGLGSWRPAHALGYDSPAPSLDAGARLLDYIGANRKPLRVYFDDENSWLRKQGLPEADLSWLRESGAELLLPLGGKSGLLGLIALGPRKSEEPYAGSDLRLLNTVAIQTSLAMENAQLTAAVAEQIAQREILNREVEIAREVQERLFPQNLPDVAGLDYHGFCRPAKGVGGDSFDFLILEDGAFAATIGDVSGKGIPAALLMASLQSALRGQASGGGDDLAAMMTRLNRILFDSSPMSRYATLFYARYETATRRLQYVNGGHNPPFLIRRGELLRLEEGGPVVGLFGPAAYTEGEVFIEAGDVLVGFTDGVSEAMNAADEEWGEENLGALAKSLVDLPAREMIPVCLAAADAFAAGAPQHDDMTMIVVKFLT